VFFFLLLAKFRQKGNKIKSKNPILKIKNGYFAGVFSHQKRRGEKEEEEFYFIKKNCQINIQGFF
jgi:hypothetical protein